MSKGGVATELIERAFNIQMTPTGESGLYTPILDVKDEDEDSLVKMVEEVLTNKQGSGLVPHDLKIDDRDMPEFPNFYQWSVDANGSGIKPFARQLWVGARAFAEICVHCSPDTSWATDILSVPVDAEIHELGERIQFLEYGVCPCCGLSKPDLFSDGSLDPIQEIALVVGQRAGKCLDGSTLIPTGEGLLRLDELARSHPKLGFSAYRGPSVVLENGKRVNPSKFYREKVLHTRKVVSSAGHTIIGTLNHPLHTTDGWVTLGELKVGACVQVHVGQNIWPTKVPTLHALAKRAKEIATAWVENIHENLETNDKVVKEGSFYTGPMTSTIARALGFFVAEGHGGVGFMVTNNDPAVHKTVRAAVKTLTGDQHWRYQGKSCTQTQGIMNTYECFFFDEILDGKLKAKSAEKFVPSIIRRCPKPLVVEFLRALYEGDGCMNKNDCDYTTISEQLANEVHSLLSNLGIISRITSFGTWASNGSSNQISKRGYNVKIEGLDQLVTFRKTIGFISRRKKARLSKVINSMRERKLDMPFWHDKLPNFINDEYHAVFEWAQDELNAQTYQCTYQRRDRAGVSKATRTYGLNTIFGYNDKPCNSSCLSKQRIRKYLPRFREYYHLLSKGLRDEIDRLIAIGDGRSTYYTYVVSNEAAGKRATYDFEVPNYHRFMANGLLNHNSKSVSFYSGYHVHRFLKLQKPTAVYGTSANEVFTGTFVGLTFSAAVRLLWSPLKELVAYSPWFTQYHAMLDVYGKRFGEELYKNSDLMLQYKHRQLVLNPAGGDKRKLRGETRTIAAQDEIGWWPLGSNQAEDEALEKSGREVYNALDRSLLTVRQAAHALWKQGYANVPTGMFFNVSSPSSKMDMIMHLYRASLHSRKMLGVQLPTWEFNPKFTRAYFNDEYMKDPVKAERDYGANPPAGADAYIPASETVDASFELPPQKVELAFKFKTSNDTLKQGAELVRGYTSGKDLPPSVMSLDAGLTKNSFAIAIGHRVAGKSTKEIPHFHFPVLIDIIPRNGARLSHSQIFRNVVIPLTKQCNVQAVLADRWNSALLLDEVQEQYGIHSAQYSVKMADFDAVKSYLEGGKFKFPKLETDVHDIMEFDPETYPYCFDGLPVDHLYLQLHTVVSTGRSVEKASGMTDDLFRAVVLAGTHLIDDEWCTEHLKAVVTRKAVVLGNVGLLSGGGGGGGGGAGSRIGSVGSRSA